MNRRENVPTLAWILIEGKRCRCYITTLYTIFVTFDVCSRCGCIWATPTPKTVKDRSFGTAAINLDCANDRSRSCGDTPTGEVQLLTIYVGCMVVESVCVHVQNIWVNLYGDCSFLWWNSIKQKLEDWKCSIVTGSYIFHVHLTKHIKCLVE